MTYPFWLVWLIPITWPVVFPVSYLMNLLVMAFTMKYLKVSDVKQKIKAVSLRVWVMEGAAGLIGTATMFFITQLDFSGPGLWWKRICKGLWNNPWNSFGAFCLVTSCIILVAFYIYRFNYKWCLQKIDLDDGKRKKLALSLAVFTAPYLFYLPKEWF